MVSNSDAVSYKEVVLKLINCLLFLYFFLGPCLAFCYNFLVYHSC